MGQGEGMRADGGVLDEVGALLVGALLVDALLVGALLVGALLVGALLAGALLGTQTPAQMPTPPAWLRFIRRLSSSFAAALPSTKSSAV